LDNENRRDEGEMSMGEAFPFLENRNWALRAMGFLFDSFDAALCPISVGASLF